MRWTSADKLYNNGWHQNDGRHSLRVVTLARPLSVVVAGEAATSRLPFPWRPSLRRSICLPMATTSDASAFQLPPAWSTGRAGPSPQAYQATLAPLRRVVRGLFVERRQAQVSHELVADVEHHGGHALGSFRNQPRVDGVQGSVLALPGPANVLGALGVDRGEDWCLGRIPVLAARRPDVRKQVAASSSARTNVLEPVRIEISGIS